MALGGWQRAEVMALDRELDRCISHTPSLLRSLAPFASCKGPSATVCLAVHAPVQAPIVLPGQHSNLLEFCRRRWQQLGQFQEKENALRCVMQALAGKLQIARASLMQGFLRQPVPDRRCFVWKDCSIRLAESRQAHQAASALATRRLKASLERVLRTCAEYTEQLLDVLPAVATRMGRGLGIAQEVG